MASSDVLVDAFERVRDAVHPAVNDLSAEQLAFRPYGESNSIAWLVWHLTRIQDDHVAGLHGEEQAWTGGGWFERFALPFDPADTGYGHGPEDVAKVTGQGYRSGLRSRGCSHTLGLAAAAQYDAAVEQ